MGGGVSTEQEEEIVLGLCCLTWSGTENPQLGRSVQCYLTHHKCSEVPFLRSDICSQLQGDISQTF